MKEWPPRDWRMMVALALLGIAGAGAWLINVEALAALTALSEKTGNVWALAYYAYGAITVLGAISLGLAMVVSLKSFRIELPGGGSLGAESDSARDPPVMQFSGEATIKPAETGPSPEKET